MSWLKMGMQIQAVTEKLDLATQSANANHTATKVALSEHDKLRTSMQDNAPLISGYYDMLDQLITVLRFSDDAIKKNSAANQIEAVTDIIRKLGGGKEGGDLFDKDAYIASRVKQLEDAASGKSGAQASGSVAANQQQALPQTGGGMKIFMPKPPVTAPPPPPPSPSTGVIP